VEDVIEEIKYKGYKIKIYYDFDPESPRLWNNAGKIVMKNFRNYAVGDEQRDFQYDNSLVEYFAGEAAGALGLDVDTYYGMEDKDSELVEDWVNRNYLWHGLDFRDYGGGQTSLSICSDTEDGFIYIPHSQALDEWGDVSDKLAWKMGVMTDKLREKALRYLEGEIETYDQYLRGDVYGFVIEDSEGEEVDSCWGYYGDYNDYLLSECKGTIDSILTRQTKEHCDKIKKWIRNQVPLSYRTPLKIAA